MFEAEKAKLGFLDIFLVQALYQLTVVFLILFYGDKIFDIDSGVSTGGSKHLKGQTKLILCFSAKGI